MHRSAPEGPGGKLKAVASQWAKGRGGGKPAEDAATKAAAAAIAEIEARRGRKLTVDGIEIGPDEIDAVRLFYSLGSQWRLHGYSGARLGIEYAAIQPTALMMGISMTPQLFFDLRVMEGAALAAFPSQ